MTWPLHIGFTGTQLGMTDAQARAVHSLVWYREFYAHHGCCVGADEEFDLIVRNVKGCLGRVLHPCTITGKQMRDMRVTDRDAVRAVKAPLVRNCDIVVESHMMIATPKEDTMQLRSGTWTTVRRTRDLQKPIAIVLPNGGILFEGTGWQV